MREFCLNHSFKSLFSSYIIRARGYMHFTFKHFSTHIHIYTIAKNIHHFFNRN
jgi:hypothetical protein